jgi:hypothetical protein
MGYHDSAEASNSGVCGNIGTSQEMNLTEQKFTAEDRYGYSFGDSQKGLLSPQVQRLNILQIFSHFLPTGKRCHTSCLFE